MNTSLSRFLNRPASIVAPLLLGCLLERHIDGQRVVVKIVETEAYEQQDAASHSYRGSTPRTAVMFGAAGYMYVYFTYGMHYCCNIVTDRPGNGSAVLIRAVEPLEGTTIMQQQRDHRGPSLTNGPAKLCQALAIDMLYNGHDLAQAPLQLLLRPALEPEQITVTRRIGIRLAQDVPWRFYITGNPYVSRA